MTQNDKPIISRRPTCWPITRPVGHCFRRRNVCSLAPRRTVQSFPTCACVHLWLCGLPSSPYSHEASSLTWHKRCCSFNLFYLLVFTFSSFFAHFPYHSPFWRWKWSPNTIVTGSFPRSVLKSTQPRSEEQTSATRWPFMWPSLRRSVW